ncbi:MAG TPA: serine/threonine-protein kinase [Polyangiaceae bacterium]
MAAAAALDLDFASEPGLPGPGAVVADRYEIRELLGEGGMSAVFTAYDRRLRRSVALKILSPRLSRSKDLVTRFVNEARTLARLDCAHIVQVFDAGVTAEAGGVSLPYMVLEHLRGVDLRTFAHNGAYDDDRVVAWMLDACEGLAAAHAEGVVHRDLKPENLFLVQPPDGSERIKILDFGIARSLSFDRSLTLAGEGVGSPGYMSPEQLHDARSADARSDLWSLGVVMYELFARQAPFAARNSLELCAEILNAPVRPLGELRPDLHPELAAIVDRCLERDPADRFGDVLELAEALAPFTRTPGLFATVRIRGRLHPPLELVVEEDDADAGASSADPAPVCDDDGSKTRVMPSGIRRRVYRRWAARSVGLLLIAAVLSLFIVSQVPAAAARARVFVSETGTRIGETANRILDPR